MCLIDKAHLVEVIFSSLDFEGYPLAVWGSIFPRSTAATRFPSCTISPRDKA